MASIKKQIKRRLPLVGIFLILLAGLGLFMYPVVSNWYGEYTAHTTINDYDNKIQELGENAVFKMQKDDDEYNKAVYERNRQKN